ncbi:MAG: zf-HC2 domain-containing protein [Deltaproteobacteria bacterium]|nr:zf-HC2 domain-containing protein [Deltaproteobacteria bacterium]
MRCSKAKKCLSAYLDDELHGRRRKALEDHLKRCSRCASDLAGLKKQWAGLSALEPSPTPPSDLWAQVSRALDEAEGMPWHRRRRVQIFRAACVTACVALGFISGALLSWPSGDPVRPTTGLSEKTLVAEAFDSTPFGLGEK